MYVAQSILPYDVNEFRCYEVNSEESIIQSKMVGSRQEIEPRPPGLSFQCFATTTKQPPALTLLYICTTQVVLNASVAHLAATQYVLSELC